MSSDTPSLKTIASRVMAAKTIADGVDMVNANAQANGDHLGLVHGGMKIAKGTIAMSGVGIGASVAMEAADLGMQAFRDAHDMSSDQVGQALQAHQGDFTPDQTSTVTEARRLFRFAKAANPGHASVNPNVSDDAMRGGHVVVEDGGAMDARLRLREGNGQSGGDRGGANKPRYNLPSSHYPGHGAVQSEHQLPSTDRMNFGTALHGTTPGPGGHSWFQMEAHSGVWSGDGGMGRAYKDYALHATDFARHKVTQQQVGPLGTSPVMENNPLTVTQQQIARSRLATAAANAGRVRQGLAANLTPLA